MTTPGRTTISLDGKWAFRHGDGPWREAVVPMPWQAQFEDLRQVSGTALYRRSFDAPQIAAPDQLVLRFGAASYHATVRLNDQVIGTHEGGYLPFECVIPATSLKPINLLEVKVILPDGDAPSTPEMPFGEIPHGKQSWYGPIGGLWQSVVLEQRHTCHLSRCAIRADLATGQVSVGLTLSQPANTEITLIDPQGKEVARGNTGSGTLTLSVPTVQPWHPDTPALYTARVCVLHSGQPVDVTEHRFGFRSVETRNGQILLNGAPFYMRGALDQDYYPEGICTPPSVAFLEDQLHKAKALGLNLLRCHIKIPDPRYYEVADRLGMLIWTEIPNVGNFTAASARRMKETMQGILERDGNHPCIIIWTLINEDWGTRLTEDASHRSWLAGMYDWLKAADPGRLVVDNSPCAPNFHVKTDLNDYHYYRSVPERRSEWDQLTTEFAAGADWTYTPYGDGQRRGDEPLIVSEFGVWGLPDPAKVATPDGKEPWWMETGSVWGDGVAYPHGIQNRFMTYRLDAAFGSFAAFVMAAQWYQFENLKYQIESMRAEAPIQGYVITEFTDVHWESNGLLDMNRNPRVFHDQFATINADIVIVPRVAHYAGQAGAAVDIQLRVALGGRSLPDGADLHWEIGAASGVIAVPGGAAGSVLNLGRLAVPLPGSAVNCVARLALKLSAMGQVLARNHVDFSVYAARETAPATARPSIATADRAIAAQARGLGYRVVAAEDADVILAAGLDAADIAALQGGARYLVLADGRAKLKNSLRLDKGPMAHLPDIGVTARAGTIWRGDWIAGFSWIRRQGAFADIPGGPLIDLSFDKVVPHHVLTGFKSWEFGGLVHAGLVAGWIHKPAALIAERQVGRGMVLVSTFRLLNDPPGRDPVATALFDALVATAAGLAVDR